MWKAGMESYGKDVTSWDCHAALRKAGQKSTLEALDNASCLHNPGLSQACTIWQILANLCGEKSFKFFHCRLAQRLKGPKVLCSVKHAEHMKHESTMS